ncbi:MAG: hypothetical protein PF487_13555, partial [Bacteroidales bacterium]|nr:hypothetical protein [Bacteroidales bacterium]
MIQSKKQYFKEVLNKLSDKEISYVLLRDDDFFNSKNKISEFDVLVPSKRLKYTKKIFNKIPNSREFKNNIDLTHPFLIRLLKDDITVDFDFQIGGIAYCGSPILKEKFLLQNTVKKNGLNYLNTEAEFLMLLIHGFVFKKKFKYFKKYEKRFLGLYLKSDKVKINNKIINMFGVSLSKEIINCIEKKNLSLLFKMQRKLRNKHLLKNP